MTRPRRRHSTGFGYIGFGNSQNVFNRKASKPFSGVKNKLNTESHRVFNTNYLHHTLTEKERLLIKNRIRKKQKRKNIVASLITTVLMLLLIIYIIKKLNFKI